MRVSAKADYAVRAMVELAASGSSEAKPAKGEVLAVAQSIPMRFLENILGELRVHGLVQSRRGSDGGYWLARPADDVTLAEIIRAVEGPLATVRGEAADEIDYQGARSRCAQVWLALRANIRQVLESVTLADVVAGTLPEPIGALGRAPRRLAAARVAASPRAARGARGRRRRERSGSARNEALFRAANERMAEWEERHTEAAGELYLCECADPRLHGALGSHRGSIRGGSLQPAALHGPRRAPDRGRRDGGRDA